MSMNEINIVMKDNYQKIDGKPIVLVGLPGTGLVGLISALHLIDSLEMDYVGYIESRQFPPVVLIHDSELALPLRIYQKGKFLVLISEISVPTEPETAYDLADKLTKWAKDLDPQYTIIMRGHPAQNRISIDKPTCYGLGTTAALNNMVEENECDIMEHGIITGVDALIFWKNSNLKIPTITLATDAYPNLPDPGAAAVLIEKLNVILDIDVDPSKLLENAEDLRLKMRDMMRSTSQQQAQMQNKEIQLPPMYG
ncbi:MAG: hypothetical protein GF329_17685 [Candidatus Lokiarchaeota archaeon]|nr:hypothetical protein [Candidatus Lokiarchaeota archaeon]